MTDWFRRKSKNITTSNKRDTSEGLWHNCPKCSAVIYRTVLKENFYTCHDCSFHFIITRNEYIDLLIDNNLYEEFSHNITSSNPLDFKDPKDYSDQIKESIHKTKKN